MARSTPNSHEFSLILLVKETRTKKKLRMSAMTATTTEKRSMKKRVDLMDVTISYVSNN